MPRHPGLMNPRQPDDVVNLPLALAQALNHTSSRRIHQRVKGIYMYRYAYVYACISRCPEVPGGRACIDGTTSLAFVILGSSCESWPRQAPQLASRNDRLLVRRGRA